jgi:cellobiose phosphorylase
MRIPSRRVPGPDLRSRWGRFEPDGDVFRVTSTDTPRPWTNLITNGLYGAFFSQHGLGYSFYRSPKTCEMTRWSVNESRPSTFDAGRVVWVKDLDSGLYWPGNPQPGEGSLYRGYACRHGLGWSEIVAERHGIRLSFLFFVPLRGPCEIWSVTVTNRSRRLRRLALVPAVELPTRSTYLNARGEYDKKLRAIRCLHPGDRMWSRMDTHFFFGLDRPVRSWDVSRPAFWGPRQDSRNPGALATGLTRSSAHNEYMVGALETRLALRPGHGHTAHGILGYAESDAQARALLRRWRRPGAAERELAAVRRRWGEMTSGATCRIPDADVGRYLSIWGKYAVAQTTHCSRGQTVGVRDMLQDLRGYLLADPAGVRGRMLWLLGYVRRDGTALRSIDPWAGRHDTNDFRDNPVWAAELVNAYVRETGDAAVLDEALPYMDGGKGTVWERLQRMVLRVARLRGGHGLTLVGGGDWNDALGPFGERGRGESAWLSLLVIRALRMLAELAEWTGRGADRARLLRWRASLAAAFNRSAWDGAWYVYGWDDNGDPIGSRRSVEGKIHANVQSWALMEGVVPAGRRARVWDSVRRYLWTDAGLLTCWPAYETSQPTGSRMIQLGMGWYENAAAYCHGTSFYMAACAEAGRGDDALAAIRSYLPTNPDNPRSDVEPFGVTSFYVGPQSPHFGRAPHSWFTGSAAWFLFVGWERLLGIVPGPRGLLVRPCVPRAWRRWTARRVWRGATYEFVFRQEPGRKPARVREIRVDGERVAGDTVPRFEGGTHRVSVVLADG